MPLKKKRVRTYINKSILRLQEFIMFWLYINLYKKKNKQQQDSCNDHINKPQISLWWSKVNYDTIILPKKIGTETVGTHILEHIAIAFSYIFIQNYWFYFIFLISILEKVMRSVYCNLIWMVDKILPKLKSSVCCKNCKISFLLWILVFRTRKFFVFSQNL